MRIKHMNGDMSSLHSCRTALRRLIANYKTGSHFTSSLSKAGARYCIQLEDVPLLCWLFAFAFVRSSQVAER